MEAAVAARKAARVAREQRRREQRKARRKEGSDGGDTAARPSAAKAKATLREAVEACVRVDPSTFLAASTYTLVANALRGLAAGAGDAAQDAARLLDNRGHFMDVAAAAAAAGGDATEQHWARVKAQHKKKFEAAGGVEGAALRRREKAVRKERKDIQNVTREHREAEAKKAAAARRAVREQTKEAVENNLCIAWTTTGDCRFGDKCNFAHPPHARGKAPVPAGAKLPGPVARAAVRADDGRLNAAGRAIGVQSGRVSKGAKGSKEAAAGKKKRERRSDGRHARRAAEHAARSGGDEAGGADEPVDVGGL